MNSEFALGGFVDSLDSEFLSKLYKNSDHELLGPALRRANLYYRYRSAVICIHEIRRDWMVLGDIYFSEELETKSQSIDREAAFQTLYHFSREKSRNLMGYYLNRPILFKELECFKVGETYLRKLNSSFEKGESADDYRRARNLIERNPEVTIKEGFWGDFSSEEKQKIKGVYSHFLSSLIRPYIGFLLAKKGDEISNSEYFFIAERDGQLEAVVSGFIYENGQFYVDRMARKSETRMIIDMLIAYSFRSLEKKEVKSVNLGLCAFYGSPELIWKFIRSLVSFWYDAESLKVFKSKYSDERQDAYYFIERRKAHLNQFVKLAWNSIYFKLSN